MNTKTNQPVNKEAFRMLAHEIGLNAACRKLGIPIPTGKSWARRGRWELSKRKGGRPGRTLLAASGASSLHPIADALKDSHKELAEKTRTSLAQAAARAAETAAAAEIPVCSTAHLKDLASAAARVFGWDAKNPHVEFNQLVITSEQLDEIRALRAGTPKEGGT
jgi:hypothetical protein